jgi:hypothetical protein
MENPYEWETQRLLSEFMNACAKAGTSNSGLVISFSAASDLQDAHCLRGVVLARIDGVKPQIKPGDQVKPVQDNDINPAPSNGYNSSRSRARKLPDVLTVESVRYMGGDRWELVFKERNDATCDTDSEYAEDGGRTWYVPLRFRAEDFELLTTPVGA